MAMPTSDLDKRGQSQNQQTVSGTDSRDLPAMSAQQFRFSVGGGLSQYKNLIVGEKGWGVFIGFELYNLILANLGSIVGLGLRRIILPLFLRHCGGAPIVGKSVTIRQPHRLSFGRGVLLDDGVVLDVRADEKEGQVHGISVGDHVLIGRNSIVVAKNGSIRLGNACNISSDCRIATQSSVEIGESVLIAAYAYIGPGNHRIDDSGAPLIEQGMDLRGGVKIGDHAWIGTRVTILDGVTIGRNAVIGAHSLVRENVPDGAVVAGVPAKIVRYRE